MMSNIVLDDDAMKRALTRMTYEIIERNKGTDNMIIVGIKTRGEYLGQRITQKLTELEGVNIPFVSLDISAYRDDIAAGTIEEGVHRSISPNNIDLTDKHVFLVDDVLYTGRTIRAAMDAVMDAGRARRISLVALIDRGHRELPIRADIVGKNIPTSKDERVKVCLTEHDGEDNVIIDK